jgi:hypothetical protein
MDEKTPPADDIMNKHSQTEGPQKAWTLQEDETLMSFADALSHDANLSAWDKIAQNIFGECNPETVHACLLRRSSLSTPTK